jgi:hypothetical protein
LFRGGGGGQAFEGLVEFLLFYLKKHIKVIWLSS